jgi:hypothetical protein
MCGKGVCPNSLISVTPLQHFEVVWARCGELSALYAYLAKNVSSALHPEELLRAEWVTRVSAFDLYIHELVAQRMFAIFEKRLPTTLAYLRFTIPSDVMNRIRDAATATDASAAFDLEVRNRLSRDSFQNPEEVADAVRLCSEVELWNEVAMKFGATPQTRTSMAKSIRKDLSLIVRRRNRIAHEGDLQPTAVRDPWPITPGDVAFVETHINKIVRAIDTVV